MTQDEWITERNSLLAVIEKQRETLKYVGFILSGRGMPPNVSDIGSMLVQAKAMCEHHIAETLAITPENCKLVEVGEVGSIAICKGTPRQVTYLRKNTRTGTKLYTLVKDGE